MEYINLSCVKRQPLVQDNMAVSLLPKTDAKLK